MICNWFSVFVLLSVNQLLIADLNIKDLTTDELQLDCLLIHNRLRDKHCSTPLKYSPKLKSFATRRATLLAKTNGKGFAHIHNPSFGENIYRIKYENLNKTDCKPIVQNWYKESVHHNWNSQIVGPYSRHFAQVLWNSTQRIGCGSVASMGANGYVYTVCNYYNSDEFPKNSTKNVLSIGKCDQILSNRKFKYNVLTNGQWLQECINEHNRIRKLHSVDPLVINDKIFQSSQKRAVEMVQKGFRFFRHKRSEFGENIHWSKSNPTNGSHSISCNESIGKWYREIDNYDWSERVSHNGTVRHFIQLVWKPTSTVGCAQVQNIEEPKGGVYTVCLYQPKADMQDADLQWENVFPPPSYTTTTTSAPVIEEKVDERVYEFMDELDDETELEKEFKDVDEIMDTRRDIQRQTPAISLEDMYVKTTTENIGFDRNEYIHKRKGGQRRKP